MDIKDIRILEVRPATDGWYWVTLYQYNKKDKEDVDYFKEWIECVNGQWDYDAYDGRCYTCFIHKKGIN